MATQLPELLTAVDAAGATILSSQSTPQQRQAAENLLAALRQSPNCLQSCRYLLEHSTSSYTYLMAVTAMKISAIRDWPSISPENKAELRRYLLQFAVSILPKRDMEYVVNVCSQSVAVLTKRGWLDKDLPNWREETVLFVQRLTSTESGSTVLLGVSLARELTSEFSSSRSSEMGLSWEFHRASHHSFEQNGTLLALFTCLTSLLQRAPPPALAAATPPLPQVLAAVTQILSEYFSSEGWTATVKSIAASQSISPPEAWRGLVDDPPGLLLFFFYLLKLYRSHADRSLATLPATSIAQLASIKGPVFPSDHARAVYLRHLLRGTSEAMQLFLSGGSHPYLNEEAVHIAQIISRLVPIFGSLLLRLEGPETSTFLEAFSRLSVAVFAPDRSDETWLSDANQMLLTAWVYLFAQYDEQNATPPPLLVECASRLYNAFVDSCMMKAQNILQDTEEQEAADDALHLTADEKESDVLESASFLGRTNLPHSLLLLSNCLALRIQTYRSFVNGATPSAEFRITILLEEIETLLRLAASLLTDSSLVVPPPVLASSREAQAILLGLIDTCISLAETETLLLTRNVAEHPALSSALSIALLSFLSRFSLTYFGEANDLLQGTLRETLLLSAPISRRFLDVLLRKLTVNLVYYQSEPSVVKKSAKLLVSLSKAPRLSKVLHTLEGWNNLCHFYSTNFALLRRMPAGAPRRLVQALMRVALTQPDEATMNASIALVVQPFAVALQTRLSHPQFASVHEDADIMGEVEHYLELFRGVVHAIELSSSPRLYPLCAQVIPALLQLIGLYRQHPHMIALVLRLFYDITRTNIDALPEDKLPELFQAASQLLQAYAQCRQGRAVVLSPSKNLKESALTDTYREVLAVLRILHVLGGHLIFAEMAGPLVVLGLNIVLSALTEELIRFPKLCTAYFSVVQTISAHPEQIASLPPPSLASFLSTLLYGLQHANTYISQVCLECLLSLALHRMQGWTPAPGSLHPFLEYLLDAFLFREFPQDLFDCGSDAFLALACAEKEKLSMLCQQLIAANPPETHQRILQAFQKLLEFNPGDRSARAAFRKTFLTELRSFLRRK